VQRELGPILNSAQRFGTVKSNVETLTYELSRVASSAEALVDAEPVGALTLKGFARPVPASLVTGLKPAS